MDPLSISGSIIAVLQLTATVLQYLNGVGNAPSERQRLYSELSGVRDMLYILHSKATQMQEDDSFSPTLRSYCVAGGTLEQYKAALERLAKILKPSRGISKVTAVITWPSKSKEVKYLFDAIERQKTLLSLVQENDHFNLSKSMKDDVAELQSAFSTLEMENTASINDDKQAKIRRWLNPPDPSVNYNRLLELRCKNTGTWFLDSQVFSEWEAIPGSLLWLYGIPGCGKSVLSSTIIEAILEHCHSNSDCSVLYFFFDFNDEEKQQPDKMVRSLIAQLSSQSKTTPQSLLSLYSSCLNGERQPAYDSLVSTLRQMLKYYSRAYLVLDALDECKERQTLLSLMEVLAGWKDASLHILATSRKERDIEEELELLTDADNRICIQTAIVNKDIHAYIQLRLQTDKTLKRWRGRPDVRREIEDGLKEKADGMFRWAVCQLDSLKTCLNLAELRKALATLPRTLDETYGRILCNIDEDHQEYALKIFRWLAYSARPLRLKEIADAVAINIGGSSRFDPGNRFPDPQDVFKVCSGLISEEIRWVDFEYQVVLRLAHFSVKEYLVSDRIRQSHVKFYGIQEMSANISICNDCLTYLLEFDEANPANSETTAKYPLALYASAYWPQHAKIAEKDISFDADLVIQLLLGKGNKMFNWLRLFDPEHPSRDRRFREKHLSTVASPLYYASLLGLNQPVKFLIGQGVDTNARGGRYNSALQASSRQGHVGIVKILLENGAEIRNQGGYQDSPLQLASHHGHVEIVQILIENGARIDTQVHGSALIEASANGRLEIVKILLENGAKVNTQEGRYGSALQAASFKGYIEIVRVLLENGAEVNAQGGFFGSALQIALTKGHIEIVKILLENGARINNGYLVSALTYLHDHVVKVLLDYGADIRSLDRHSFRLLKNYLRRQADPALRGAVCDYYFRDYPY